MADILDLPFDQYQRYELVHSLLESVRQLGETFHVLDVGGRTALLRDFLPGDRVDLVDVEPSEVGELVLGSGARLPFRDNSVDVVAAFDTLEHVPPDLREAFVAECGRVARRYVMLAGPYHSPRVAEAEEVLLEFLKTRLEWEHRYLAEHRQNGLPDAQATTRGLEAAGAKVTSFGHGALDRWLLLMSLELYVEHEPLLRELAPRIYRLYNEHLFQSDHGDDVYRHAIVGVFDGSPAPSLKRVLTPVGSAPPELIRFLTTVGHEILRYDAVRDSFRPEMDRLHAVVESLNKDLGEHRAVLEALGLDLTESKRSLATLNLDLVESKKTIDALRQEAERERSEQCAVIADKDERLGAVSADLEGHRETLSTIQQLRADELEELEKRGARIEEMGRELQLIESRRHEAHLELVDALHRVESTAREKDRAELEKAQLGETQARLRVDLAQALAEAETAEERRAILDEQDMTLEQELRLLIVMRDRRLQERDEARGELAAVQAQLADSRAQLAGSQAQFADSQAQLAASHDRVGSLQHQLDSRWMSVGKFLRLVRRDPREA